MRIFKASTRTTFDMVMSRRSMLVGCSSSLSSKYNTVRDLLTIRTPQMTYPRTISPAVCPPNRSFSRSTNHPIIHPTTAEPESVSPGPLTAEPSQDLVGLPASFAPSTSTHHPDQGPRCTSNDEQRRYRVGDADFSIAEAHCPDSC